MTKWPPAVSGESVGRNNCGGKMVKLRNDSIDLYNYGTERRH